MKGGRTDGALLGGQVLGAVGVHRRGVRDEGVVRDEVRVLCWKQKNHIRAGLD